MNFAGTQFCLQHAVLPVIVIHNRSSVPFHGHFGFQISVLYSPVVFHSYLCLESAPRAGDWTAVFTIVLLDA